MTSVEPAASGVPQSVVVPLDGSHYAESAIEPAKALAKRLGVGAGAVQVFRDDASVDPSYLEGIVASRGLDWHAAVADPDTAAGISAVADARDGLVCMATHGHGRATAIIGSTAEHVLAADGRPIVVIGRGVDPSRLRPVDRLVIPLDGTDESETICQPAIGFARALGVVVNLVTVVSEPLSSLGEDTEPSRLFGPHGDPEKYIADAVKRHAVAGVEVVGEVITDPISPASGLRQLLRDVPSAMLAMATRGRTGMQRLIHGSVAGKIVDESPVPAVLITVPHKDVASG